MTYKERQAKRPAKEAQKAGVAIKSQPEAGKQPLAEPAVQSVYDVDSLKRMGKEELLALARKTCEERGITTPAELLKDKGMGHLIDALGKLGLVRDIFSKPPASAETSMGHASTLYNPAATAGLSGAADGSEAKRVADQIAEIERITSPGADALKLSRFSELYGKERQRIIGLGIPEAELDELIVAANAKNDAGASLDDIEHQLVQLGRLKERKTIFQGIMEAGNMKRISAVEARNGSADEGFLAGAIDVHMEGADESGPLPASAAAPPPGAVRKAKGHGLIRRFFSSPTLWAAAGMGILSYATYSTGFFQDTATHINKVMGSHREISEAIRRLWEARLQLPPLDSAKGVELIFYGIPGLGFIMSMISKHFGAGKIARDYADVSDSQFREMRAYAIEQVSDLVKRHGNNSAQHLFHKMLSDEQLFDSLDTLRRNGRVFAATMKEAKLPDWLLRHRIDAMLVDVEVRIITAKLEPYLGAGEEQRLGRLQQLHDTDDLLRRKLNEVLRRAVNGSYLYPHRSNLASMIGNENAEAGEEILLELERDFRHLERDGS
ncbi:hypothetical protein H0O00_02930 [Candidatus Micrarchaeota archaeon]|nr:hypothetical protein [Candidatus Micrarchaeota archaeon]